MRIEYTGGDNNDFIKLCHELDAFLNELVGGEENRLEYIPYNKLDDNHDVVLLYDLEKPIGCASIKKYNDECAEVKRVFIRKEYRGQGLSIRLMEELEKIGRNKGYRSFVLETGEILTAAMGLYKKIGYKVIQNYGPYVNMPESVCMKKNI